MAQIKGLIQSNGIVYWLNDNSLIQGEHLVEKLVFLDPHERLADDVATFNFILPDGVATRSYLGIYNGTETIDDVEYSVYSMDIDKMVLFHKQNMTGTLLEVSLSIINESDNTIRKSISADLIVDPSAILVMDNTAIDDSEYLELATMIDNLKANVIDNTTASVDNALETSVDVTWEGESLDFAFHLQKTKILIATRQEAMTEESIYTLAPMQDAVLGDYIAVINNNNEYFAFTKITAIQENDDIKVKVLKNVKIKGEQGIQGVKGDEALVCKNIVEVQTIQLPNTLYIAPSSLNRTPYINERVYLLVKNDNEELFSCLCSVANLTSLNVQLSVLNSYSIKGDQGIQGIQGESATIRVGTVSVTTYDGEPQVINRGTTGDAIFDFVIPQGKPFRIAKSYASIQAMQEDYSGTDTELGDFVIIATVDVEEEDNAKLYRKGASNWEYITDLSGATGIQGLKGDTGNGISSITTTKTTNATNVLISMTDGTSKSFSVPDGIQGETGLKALTYGKKLENDVLYQVDEIIKIVSGIGDIAFNREPVTNESCFFVCNTNQLLIAKYLYKLGTSDYYFKVTSAIYTKGEQGIQGIQGLKGDTGENSSFAGTWTSGTINLTTDLLHPNVYTIDKSLFAIGEPEHSALANFVLVSSDGYLYNCLIYEVLSSTQYRFIATSKLKIKGDKGDYGDGSFVISYETNSLPEVDDVFSITEETILEMIRNTENIKYICLFAKCNGTTYAFMGSYVEETSTALKIRCLTNPFVFNPTALSELENDTGFITEADIPTQVSAFTNDVGYLTEHQSLDNYYTKAETDLEITDYSVPFRLSGLTQINPSSTGFRTSSLYVDQNGTNRKITVQQIKDLNTKIVSAESVQSVISSLDVGDYIYLNED